jgi:tetratricopeptide (TPR) repeat protein
LANDASDRAANAIQRKAEGTLSELDRGAQRLLAQVPEQDDRAIVSDQGRRSELISLAHKIDGFEVNRFILPNDIPLTPSCMFLRGMAFHLDQQFQDALDCWEIVALNPGSSDRLRSSAWYWIGYERNNLGDFENAEQAFDQARSTAQGSRLYELQRIQLETRFFNKARESAYRLTKPFEDLRDEVLRHVQDEHTTAALTRVQSTLGNVRQRAGDDARNANDAPRAVAEYTKAIDAFRLADAGGDRWAVFGLAEALYRRSIAVSTLGDMPNLPDPEADLAEALELFSGRVRSRAIDEYLNRVEPRTKVLARTTELICCKRVPALRRDIATCQNNVIEALGVVDERLTVYSQIQRRNVPKSEFRRDVDLLISEEIVTDADTAISSSD